MIENLIIVGGISVLTAWLLYAVARASYLMGCSETQKEWEAAARSGLKIDGIRDEFGEVPSYRVYRVDMLPIDRETALDFLPTEYLEAELSAEKEERLEEIRSNNVRAAHALPATRRARPPNHARNDGASPQVAS